MAAVIGTENDVTEQAAQCQVMDTEPVISNSGDFTGELENYFEVEFKALTK